MTPEEILAHLQEVPQDGELSCAVCGPLEGLRTLPQVFRNEAEQAEEDPDCWEVLADYLETQLEDFAGLTTEAMETLTLDFDMTEDLQYALAIVRARPELELAVTMVMPRDEDDGFHYYAWYSPAGSNTIIPTKTPKSWEDPFMADVCDEDENGKLCTGGWGFPDHVLTWFPVENICAEGLYSDEYKG